MTIEGLLTQLEELGIKLATDGAELTIDAPKGALTPELIKQLKANKQGVIDYLANMPKTIPMTGMQQDTWMAIQLEPAVTQAYNLATGLRLEGPLQVTTMVEALQQLVQRHDALRTVPDAAGSVQHILPSLQLDVPVVDLSDLLPAEKEARFDEIKLAEVSTPFDLVNGPLFRAQLIKLAADEHVLLMDAHHIIVDGWSLGVISQNLAQLYTAVSTHKTAVLPDLVPLHEYIHDQTELDQKPSYQKSKAYWLNQYADTVPVLELPADRKRPSQRSFRAHQINRPLDAELVAKIKVLAVRQNITFFSFMMTACHTLLHRLSGQPNVVVGIPVAGQLQYVGRDLVGDCVNFLPIRFDFEGDASFSSVLETVARVKLPDSISHQFYPYGSLLKNLLIKRDLSRLPLISVVFNLFPSVPVPGFHQLVVTPMQVPNETLLYDIFLNVIDTPEGSLLQFLANADLFDLETVERYLDAYVTLLETAVSDPHTPINQLSILNEEAAQKMLVAWNDTATEYDRAAMLPQLFEAQVESVPGKTAVIFEDQQLTYADLNQRANQLAHHLQSLGVQPDQFVGICVERSLDMLVSVLGIHKAGAAYLPMDPDYPAERLAYMLADTQASILITQSNLRDALPAFSGTCILIDQDWPQIASCRQENPTSTATSANLAYVIYTSGSTGKPKGVQIEHRQVVNLITSLRNKPGFTADDALLAVTTLSFDMAIPEIFLTLTTGARFVLASQEVAADGQMLSEALAKNNITVMQATPTTWRLLLNSGWEGDGKLQVWCGGEAMSPELAKELLERCGSLWNMYGPTEITVFSNICQVKPDFNSISIGKPIGNTQCYIVDANNNPTPIGVPGELLIGGDGLARGYLNQPGLTAEKFITHPFTAQPDARLYRTGDLARYLADGNVEYLGRMDHQVKIRGFRIELGEIEHVLAGHPVIHEVVVTAREDTPGDQRLVAYVIAKENEEVPATSDLRDYLREKLPDYMTPAAFVSLDEFPLTPNKKVDRQNLPVPSYARVDEQTYVEPQNEVEEVIALLMADVLKLERVGAHDDFFEYGGHSLLATQFMLKVQDSLFVKVPLRHLFITPTVAGLAKFILQDAQHKRRVARAAQLYLQLSQLSDDDVKQMLAEKGKA